MIDSWSPVVTVYVANHNYGRFVEQAITSVLGQSFEEYELIIIDDGSTDDSREIITRFQNHPRIRVIFQENKGLNKTNNVALKNARGKYFMRLDADDYLDSHALLVMVSVIESDPKLALVFPDYFYVDCNGRVTGLERRHDFSIDVSLFDQPAHGACTLIRTSVLKEVGGYSEAYSCQDGYDLWVKIIDKHKVKNVNLPLFYYRRHAENLTNNLERIVETRAKIKKDHADCAGRPRIKTLALIPVRGPMIDAGNPVLEDLGGRSVLGWTVEAALEAESVSGVIVSSPDKNVLSHVRRCYGDKVLLHERPKSMARENLHVDETLGHALAACTVDFVPSAYLFLYADYPLRSSLFAEKAINTMRIYNVDSVVGVTPESEVYFRHTGGGLEIVGNNAQLNALRVERDYLYRMTGGLQLVKASFFHETGKHLGGVIGQIIVSERAAVRVSDALGLEHARLVIDASSTTTCTDAG